MTTDAADVAGPVDPAAHPYSRLTPETILDAIESAGFPCDGRMQALNSYENRVYQIWLDDGRQIVAKFYRPGRWSTSAILEEHAFARELAEHEIPVVAPLELSGGQSLGVHGEYRFAVFPRRPGRAPELDDEDVLERIGRFLGRVHSVGAAGRFVERPELTVARFGEEPFGFLTASGMVPPELGEAFAAVVGLALGRATEVLAQSAAVRRVRLHGDCHAGNVLWSDDGPHFVDLDDCMTGPAVQDLWMLLGGEREVMAARLRCVLRGYRMFREFDPAELRLIEALRGLRMIHYAGWLGRRWDDPAFPASFPWFNTPRYWQDLILQLREQVAAIDEPPLESD